jgi:hypothetical protein
LAAIIAISLFLVFSKRLHEKQLPAKSQRVSLAAYSLEFLKQCVMVTMVIAICFYALYVIETRYDYYSYFSIMVVLFGFLRYLHLVDQQKVCGDPVSDFFSDKALMISVALWIALFYLGGFIA